MQAIPSHYMGWFFFCFLQCYLFICSFKMCPFSNEGFFEVLWLKAQGFIRQNCIGKADAPAQVVIRSGGSKWSHPGLVQWGCHGLWSLLFVFHIITSHSALGVKELIVKFHRSLTVPLTASEEKNELQLPENFTVPFPFFWSEGKTAWE